MIDKLIKEFPRAIVISFGIFFSIVLVKYLIGLTITLDLSLAINFGYSMLYGLSLYYANAFVFIYLDTVYKETRFSVQRLIVGFVSTFFITLFVIFLLRVFEEVIVEKQSFTAYIESEKASYFIMPVVIFLIISLAIHAFYFYKALQETKVKEQKIIATTANAQFESLKNQIDPHFLFNSLNVLSSLIEENPENAQKFTTSLSKIYRYVLEQKDKELVAVKEELAFAKIYMQLLAMRFENSISYELPENTNLDAKVVPLSLQLLLENCIKHNIVSSSKPLHIKISIEDNQLVIENNWQKKEVLSDGKGVGLQNIVNRYALLTERQVKIIQNEKSFKVYLPILTKQILIMRTSQFNEENSAYLRAKKRVEELKGFYGNLTSYCVVIPSLALINYYTYWDHKWFVYPMLGWGLGLTFHAFGVFGYGKSWEERKIQEFLNKDKTNNWE
jgi:sensor histidine kinase YesM